MLKGLGELKAKAEQARSFSNEDRILLLKIKDGEHARIRILTDTEDIIKAGIHEVTKTTPKGPVYPKIYCTKEDGGVCEECNRGDIPKSTLFFWVYVYEIMHKRQNPQLEQDPNATRWTQVKLSGTVYYREDVNGPRILRTKRGNNKYIEKMFVDYADEYGTWCDRDYRWSRTGSSMDDTSYSLVPKDPSKMTKEITEVVKSLPKLTDYVMGKTFVLHPESEDSNISKNKSDESDDGIF